jgi:PAS domain S-box-containing protein
MNKMDPLTRALEPSRFAPDAGDPTHERLAKERLAAIVESSDDAILSKDLNGIIQSWNAGAERLFGYTSDEVLGQCVTLLIPEGRRDEEPRILERIRRGERVKPYETVRQRKDGSLVDISLTVSPIRDSFGRVVGASKIARDISARKHAEAALVRRMREQTALHEFTDRLYRAKSIGDVYEAALDAITRAIGCSRASILLFDESGVMRFVAWRGLSEDYRHAVEGHSPWPCNSADPDPITVADIESADIAAAVKAAIRAERMGALAFFPLVSNGALIGKFMTYYPEPHAFVPNEIELAVTIARQLGFSIGRMRAEEARHQAETALRESERRLQHALVSGRMGAWEWDIASGEVIWSPNLEAIHGLEPGGFGGSFEDFKRDIHSEDLDAVLACIQQALERRSDYHVVYRIKRPDDAVRHLEAFGRFVLDTCGNPTKLSGVCMDITERQLAEEQRDLLVAELSHRVKNTLATVVSIAQQSLTKHQSFEEARDTFSARIRALGQTHGRLAEANWSGVSFETILLDELAPYRRNDGANLFMSGPLVTLTPKQALTLGMAIHELTTNAAKYGALSTESGRVHVDWRVNSEPRRLVMSWVESGGPPVPVPQRSGFGRLLLERALAADLKGDVRLDFSPLGLRCDIAVPL